MSCSEEDNLKHAASQQTQLERRLLYKRSHSIATVPQASHSAQLQHSYWNNRPYPSFVLSHRGSPSIERRRGSSESVELKSSTGNLFFPKSKEATSSDLISVDDALIEAAIAETANISPAGILVLNGQRNSSSKLKRTRFQRAVSTIEPVITVEREEGRFKHSGSGGSTGHGAPPKSPSAPPRSPITKSGSTTLLNRVKERIRDRVMQASEWPNAAAMMHERRQRANESLEASFNASRDLALMQQIVMHDMHKKSRSRTEPASSESSAKGQSVRQAFIRRRSISEDTYDRSPCQNLNAADELRPLSQEHKSLANRLFKRSPRPHRKPTRAQSLDSAKMNRLSADGQPIHSASMESSTSTISSCPTVDSVGSSSNVGSTSKVDPTDVCIKLPEIVLDNRSKDSLGLIEKGLYGGEDDDDDDDYDQDPSLPSTSRGRRMSKPVPEVIFDEHGQTWDIYGAEFDPEVVGMAIQKHLERIMTANLNPERRMSLLPLSYQEEMKKEMNKEKAAESSAPAKSSDRGFWLRFLCLFTNREVRS